MGCLGVHFSLSEDEVEAILGLDEADRVDYVQEVIEENYLADDSQRAVQSDKAWDAMHRALADGELSYDGGDYPLNHVVLGGEPLYGEEDYIMVLKTPGQVRDVATALPAVDKADFRKRYFAIDPERYQPITEEDFDDTWDYFEDVRTFFLRAATEGRYVLFTADQ